MRTHVPLWPVRPEEILDLGEYEKVRDRFRARIIALKRLRRVGVGDHVSLVFENHDTVLWQIQEMVRTERIGDPAAIRFECDTYNEICPAAGELSATLFIEIVDQARAREMLDQLIGLDEHVVLRVGPHAIRAEFDPGRSTAERIAAVQYVKFRLPPEAIQELRRPAAEVTLEIDHPNYRAKSVLGTETRASLVGDLTARGRAARPSSAPPRRRPTSRKATSRRPGRKARRR